ncbi:MAG: hypothetical protein U9R79_17640 [Armatimonadota bacterium]|nr:hypothetical protein [Armatimonadota bacterium]
MVDAQRMEIVSRIPTETLGMVPEDWLVIGNPEQWISGGVWSPDGSRFALSVSPIYQQGEHLDPPATILVPNADGSSVRTVGDFPGVRSLRLTDWAANDRLLVIEDRERLAFIDPESGEREVVFGVPAVASTHNP